MYQNYSLKKSILAASLFALTISAGSVASAWPGSESEARNIEIQSTQERFDLREKREQLGAIRAKEEQVRVAVLRSEAYRLSEEGDSKQIRKFIKAHGHEHFMTDQHLIRSLNKALDRRDLRGASQFKSGKGKYFGLAAMVGGLVALGSHNDASAIEKHNSTEALVADSAVKQDVGTAQSFADFGSDNKK